MNTTITSRLDLLLAKIAGYDVDIGTMTPPVASNPTEKFLLEIARRVDKINYGDSDEIHYSEEEMKEQFNISMNEEQMRPYDIIFVIDEETVEGSEEKTLVVKGLVKGSYDSAAEKLRNKEYVSALCLLAQEKPASMSPYSFTTIVPSSIGFVSNIIGGPQFVGMRISASSDFGIFSYLVKLKPDNSMIITKTGERYSLTENEYSTLVDMIADWNQNNNQN